MIFWDRKSQNRFFFNFFITKSPKFISNINNNFSQLSFEVYNICVAQKLQISEFLIKFLFDWTLVFFRDFKKKHFATTNSSSIFFAFWNVLSLCFRWQAIKNQVKFEDSRGNHDVTKVLRRKSPRLPNPCLVQKSFPKSSFKAFVPPILSDTKLSKFTI